MYLSYGNSRWTSVLSEIPKRKKTFSATQMIVDMVSTSTHMLNGHIHRSSQPSGGSRELKKKE